MFHIAGDLPQNSTFDRHLKLTTYQAAEVMQFAINNAENHLRYVLKIVNHLQYKLLEKFKENKNCS